MLSRSERAVAATALITAIWNDRDPSSVRSRISPAYARHNPANTDGADALLRDIAAVPAGTAAVAAPQRSLADGEFAAVHSQYVWSPLGQRDEGGGFAAVDVFRFDDGGKVVEHWHRAQPAAPTSLNGHTMFDGGGDPAAKGDTELNKSLVHRLFKAYREGDLGALDELVVPDYQQHNPNVPNGRESLKTFIGRSRSVDATLQQVIAEGDLVLALTEMTAQSLVGVEMYRIAGGRIAEHWDVLQPRGEP